MSGASDVNELRQITPYENDVEYRTVLPSAETHFDALYMPIRDSHPWESDSSWGLYQADGNIVESAA